MLPEEVGCIKKSKEEGYFNVMEVGKALSFGFELLIKHGIE